MSHPGGAGQTVDGDPDGHHVRPGRRLLQQLQKGVHPVEGEKQQPVLLTDLVDDAGGPVQVLRPPGTIGRKTEGLPLLRGQGLHEIENPVHIQRSLVHVDLPVFQARAALQQAHELPAHLPGQLQADGRLAGPLLQELAHAAADVLSALLQQLRVQVQIRVPGDTENTAALQLILPEKGGSIVEKDGFHPDEPPRVSGHGQDGRESRRNRQEPQGGGPFPAAHQSRRVQGLVGQMGEGMPGVHDLRGQHRQDLRLVAGGDKLPLLRRQLLHGEIADSFPAQQGGHVGVQPVLDFNEAGDDAVDLRELSGGGEARLVVGLLRGDQAEIEEVPHPDHEELVQVPGEDGDEFQPLQQGHRLVPRLLQHPAVEPEPAQLPALGVGVISVGMALGQDRHQTTLPSLL